MLVIALGCNRAAAQGDSVSGTKTIHIEKSKQKCDINDEKDWEKVEVRKMENGKNEPKGFALKGEAFVKVHGAIKLLDDLNKIEMAEIKMLAAKYGSCVVYVDLSGFYNDPKSQFWRKGEIYYYFGNEK